MATDAVSLTKAQNFLIQYRTKTIPTITVVALLALGAVVIGALAIVAASSSHSNLAPFEKIGMKEAIAMTAVGGTLLLPTVTAALLILFGKQNEATTESITASATKTPTSIELRRIFDWTKHPDVHEILCERNEKVKKASGFSYEPVNLNELLAENYSSTYLPQKPDPWSPEREKWGKKVQEAADKCQKPAVFASENEKDVKDQIAIFLLTNTELGMLTLEEIAEFSQYQRLALMQRLTIVSQLHKTIGNYRREMGTLEDIRNVDFSAPRADEFVGRVKELGFGYLLQPEQVFDLLTQEKVEAKVLFPIGNEIEQAHTQQMLQEIVKKNRNAVCGKLSRLSKEYAKYLPPAYVEWYNSPRRTPSEKKNSLKPDLEL